jgi:hypothetical protein
MVKADSGEYDERTEYLESDGNIRSMHGLLWVAVGMGKFVTVE